jgi:hypothetical protein
MKILKYVTMCLLILNFIVSCTVGKVFPELEISRNSIEDDVLRYLNKIDNIAGMKCQYS